MHKQAIALKTLSQVARPHYDDKKWEHIKRVLATARKFKQAPLSDV